MIFLKKTKKFKNKNKGGKPNKEIYKYTVFPATWDHLRVATNATYPCKGPSPWAIKQIQ